MEFQMDNSRALWNKVNSMSPRSLEVLYVGFDGVGRSKKRLLESADAEQAIDALLLVAHGDSLAVLMSVRDIMSTDSTAAAAHLRLHVTPTGLQKAALAWAIALIETAIESEPCLSMEDGMRLQELIIDLAQDDRVSPMMPSQLWMPLTQNKYSQSAIADFVSSLLTFCQTARSQFDVRQ